MNHSIYMTRALALAKRGRLTVSPNPMVGCIIVNNNKIVGKGFHQFSGGAHAEVMALAEAGEKAKDATLYVTLEPCCHEGKTPPCINAILKAQIKKVYVACLDPNPLMQGKGIKALQDANIETHLGLHEKKSRQLNQIFFHYMQHQRPFVIAKWAMSLDGKMTTHIKDSRQISNHAAKHQTHLLRQQVDAILIGANTLRKDDPELTVRDLPKGMQAKHPLRIVLSTESHLPTKAKIFDPSLPGKTIIVATKDRDTPGPHIDKIILPKNKNDKIDLSLLLRVLGERGITSLLIEGGSKTHESFLAEGLINQVQVFLAPTLIGSLPKKYDLRNMTHIVLDNNYYFVANTGES